MGGAAVLEEASDQGRHVVDAAAHLVDGLAGVFFVGGKLSLE